MRVIYFTYVQSTGYLRFYYKPSVPIDGIIAIENGQSFVYFITPQQNVQETLRSIDKDIELEDCRFSYNMEDLFFYMSKPNAVQICRQTTVLLSYFFSKIQSETHSQKNNALLSHAKGYSISIINNTGVFKRPLNFLN
jgi:hypothetical protein